MILSHVQIFRIDDSQPFMYLALENNTLINAIIGATNEHHIYIYMCLEHFSTIINYSMYNSINDRS